MHTEVRELRNKAEALLNYDLRRRDHARKSNETEKLELEKSRQKHAELLGLASNNNSPIMYS